MPFISLAGFYGRGIIGLLPHTLSGDKNMAKSQDAKKNVKKQPTRTPAEKKALKQEKKNKQDK